MNRAIALGLATLFYSVQPRPLRSDSGHHKNPKMNIINRVGLICKRNKQKYSSI